jgi:hypothetical protein
MAQPSIMSTNLAQEFLFQRIKELLPPQVSLADAVSEILHVSNDSAYRRIRNETPLVLEEAKQLCEHFHLSLDQALNIRSNSILFQNIRINNQEYSYEKYLSDLIKLVQYLNSFNQKEVIYLTKDVPLFHNFYYQPLIAFRYFFWMKTILQHPDYSTKAIDLNGISKETESLSRELIKAYTQVPSTEIWNTECINSLISQIEFYKDSGLFSSSADIKAIFEALEETILLGDNTIWVKTDNVKAVYLNYDVLNYMVTRDESFCDQCYGDMQNLMHRATVISQTSEKQRNIFFGILLAKIEDRIKKL